ncbi:hypothetical protein NPIL_290661 [Nephila pilipes]|uniref:Uncharacterized protein n=1 Tax=Nephila pilipes TaxID=299642 RepID=A0A8X6QVL6_NEPPI|nr:hypothetical protein NPIL_290661 [Nephila pilipes]
MEESVAKRCNGKDSGMDHHWDERAKWKKGGIRRDPVKICLEGKFSSVSEDYSSRGGGGGALMMATVECIGNSLELLGIILLA